MVCYICWSRVPPLKKSDRRCKWAKKGRVRREVGDEAWVLRNFTGGLGWVWYIGTTCHSDKIDMC